MAKLPFYIGNLVACMVYGTQHRRHVRAYINLVFFWPAICHFIHTKFNEHVHSIKFVRQITLGRVVFLVNDKYFVKIFRDVSNRKLKNYKFLLNYVRPYLSIEIPQIVVDNHLAMYASPRLAGRHIGTFPLADVMQNQDKIISQVQNIVDQLQSINVDDIPDNGRFMDSMQTRTVEQPCEPHPVLAHFDLNESNFLFDDDMNICAVIDWDTLSIAKNPQTDMTIFMKYWERYLNWIQKQ